MSLVSYKYWITSTFKKSVREAGDSVGKSIEATKAAEKQLETLDGGTVRSDICKLQAALGHSIASGELQEVGAELTHTFAPGVYMRTAYIKAGSIIVGKIHKHKHGNILSHGKATVMTESGGLQHIEGFLSMVSEAGTKRAVYAHTDLIWTTIHLTDSTDLEQIEKELIAPTYEDYEKFLLESEPMKKIEVTL
jgi:hypothetical protein